MAAWCRRGLKKQVYFDAFISGHSDCFGLLFFGTIFVCVSLFFLLCVDTAMGGEKLTYILLLEFSDYLNLLSVSTCLLVHRCSARVGKKYAELGRQAISIGDGCNNVGTIIHEMMHTLGKNTIVIIMIIMIILGGSVASWLAHSTLFERSDFDPRPGTLFCVLEEVTLVSQCRSSSRCINGFGRI